MFVLKIIVLYNYFLAQVLAFFKSLNCSFYNYESEVQSSYFRKLLPKIVSIAAGDVDEVKCSITSHIFIKQWVERQHNLKALSYLW